MLNKGGGEQEQKVIIFRHYATRNITEKQKNVHIIAIYKAYIEIAPPFKSSYLHLSTQTTKNDLIAIYNIKKFTFDNKKMRGQYMHNKSIRLLSFFGPQKIFRVII